MQTRKPVVAGQFYPADRKAALNELREYIDKARVKATLPDTIVAGIVPHAGWTFSGTIAALVFNAIKQKHDHVDTFIIFGAAHSYFGMTPAISERNSWLTPLGEAPVDTELSELILENSPVVADSSAHRYEHSIEVQVPFIQLLFPDSKILPIVVPPTKEAITIGRQIADIASQQQSKKMVCIGSTDLTHYGPRYGFMPMGTGPTATDWATNVNDVKFIDAALKLDPQQMLDTAMENHSACGPGAAAAAVSYAKATGRSSGILLDHINSNQIMSRIYGPSEDTVGYAAIIF